MVEPSAFHAIYTKREAALPFYITSIGTTPAEYRIYRPAGIDSYQLLYTEKGKGRIKIYDHWVAVPEKSLMLIPPNTTHFYEMQGDVWETCWITFSGWGVERFFDIDEMVIPVPDEVCFLEKFNEIFSFWRSEQWNLQSSAYLYSLLLECRELVPEKTRNAYILRKKLKACLEYINNNYMNVIELTHLAKISGVTPEHLCRIFKQYMGIRPFEYITKIRLQKAKELLVLNRDMNISDIANLSGFQSSSYFSSVFRKHEGVTAEEFRNF